MTDGWGFPHKYERAHYFENGHALCSRRVQGEAKDSDEIEDDTKCKSCIVILKMRGKSWK